MTALPYSFWCYHLTEVEGVQWRQADWDVGKIVKGLKQEPFKGYVRLKAGSAWRDYTPANIDDFISRLMAAMGEKLRTQVDGKISIVPIPNSEMALNAKGNFRVVDLAKQLAGGFGADAAVVPAIRWNKVRDKAHKRKGYRHPDLYQPLMRLAERPKTKTVLFDDVLTSGSQMIAAARFMKAEGFDAVHAVSVAKAVKVQHDNVFGWKLEELQVEHTGWEFDEEF